MADMYMKVMDITPDMAKQFLEKNKMNRTINPRTVRVFIRELEHGEFELTHQGIAIAEDGTVVDGQHRLTAIVTSGITAKMAVFFNVKRSSKIDRGRNRRDQDALYMSGKIDKKSNAYKRVTFPLVRLIALRNLSCPVADYMTPDNRMRIYEKHKEVIDPVVDIVERHKTNRGASIMYAMCCAYKAGVGIETLKKWHDIICTGDFYDDDIEKTKAGRGVLLFKRFIDQNGSGPNNTSERTEEVIKKAMSSIYHFNNNDEITKLYGSLYYEEIKLKESDLYKE